MEPTTNPYEGINYKILGKDIYILLDVLQHWRYYEEDNVSTVSTIHPSFFFKRIKDLKFEDLLGFNNIFLVDDREVWNLDEFDTPKYKYLKHILDFFDSIGMLSKVTLMNNNLNSNYKFQHTHPFRHEPIVTFLLNSRVPKLSADKILRLRYEATEYRFSLLNRKPRKHRLEIYNFLADNNILDQTLHAHNTYVDVDKMIDPNDFADMPRPLYKRSLINIVTETVFYKNINTGDCSFLTEKTGKCLSSMMPFILVSNYGQLRHLKKLGFQTYGSVFDETYDTIVDDNERMKAVQKLILDISNWSERELRYKIPDMLNIAYFNFKHYFKLVEARSSLPTINFDTNPYYDFVCYKDLLKVAENLK